MWISFAARIVNPASSIRAMIFPVAPFATASGFTIASVRCLMPSSPRVVARRRPYDDAGQEECHPYDERHPVTRKLQAPNEDDAEADHAHDRPRHHQAAAR